MCNQGTPRLYWCGHFNHLSNVLKLIKYLDLLCQRQFVLLEDYHIQMEEFHFSVLDTSSGLGAGIPNSGIHLNLIEKSKTL